MSHPAPELPLTMKPSCINPNSILALNFSATLSLRLHHRWTHYRNKRKNHGTFSGWSLA